MLPKMPIRYRLEGKRHQQSQNESVLLKLLLQGNSLKDLECSTTDKYSVILKICYFHDSIAFDKLLSVNFSGMVSLDYNGIRALSYCKSLIYFRLNSKRYKDDNSFIAVYLFMQNETSHKVNLMFTDLYRASLRTLFSQKKVNKAVYLLTLAANKVHNVFYTYVDQYTNRIFYHLFLTALEKMNRSSAILRGCFLGGDYEAGLSSSIFNSYVEIYPLARPMKHPNSFEEAYFNVPFRQTITFENMFTERNDTK